MVALVLGFWVFGFLGLGLRDLVPGLDNYNFGILNMLMVP